MKNKKKWIKTSNGDNGVLPISSSTFQRFPKLNTFSVFLFLDVKKPIYFRYKLKKERKMEEV